MKAYYVDLVRGSHFTLIAGPFPDEPTARRYELVAVNKAFQLDARRQFDRFGVTSVEGYSAPGELNDEIDIDPADLLTLH